MGIRPKSFHPFIASRDNVDIFVELSVERPSNVDRGRNRLILCNVDWLRSDFQDLGFDDIFLRPPDLIVSIYFSYPCF